MFLDSCSQDGVFIHLRRYVHISEEVYSLLDDEFHIIPGRGGTRSNTIKDMGITTYLVQPKVCCPTTPVEVSCYTATD